MQLCRKLSIYGNNLSYVFYMYMYLSYIFRAMYFVWQKSERKKSRKKRSIKFWHHFIQQSQKQHTHLRRNGYNSLFVFLVKMDIISIIKIIELDIIFNSSGRIFRVKLDIIFIVMIIINLWCVITLVVKWILRPFCKTTCSVHGR